MTSRDTHSDVIYLKRKSEMLDGLNKLSINQMENEKFAKIMQI